MSSPDPRVTGGYIHNTRLYTKFNFTVDFSVGSSGTTMEAVDITNFKMGFTEVNVTPTVKFEPIPYRVGADLWTNERFWPGRVDFGGGELELKYGMCVGDAAVFYQFITMGVRGVLGGVHIRVNSLDNNDGRVFQAWEFFDAWPTEYQNGSGWNATANEGIIDTIKFKFHHWERFAAGATTGTASLTNVAASVPTLTPVDGTTGGSEGGNKGE